MEYILILGAKSDIARDIARIYAESGYSLYLAARQSTELEAFASDLRIKNDVDVQNLDIDILDYTSHQKFYDSLKKAPVGVVSAVGYLGSQELAESSFSEAKKILDTNYTGLVSIFEIIAKNFKLKKSGFIVGISSVAGDRGRKSNYHYGAAKAAFSTYLSGLRNRLYDSGVHVLTVKPGFVATKMTANLDLPSRLTGSSSTVAKDIVNAQRKRVNILYTISIWRLIMLVIKSIPEFQFKKMSI